METFTSRSARFQALSDAYSVVKSTPREALYGAKTLGVPVRVLPHDMYIIESYPDGSIRKANDVSLFLNAQSSASRFGLDYLNAQSTRVPDPLSSVRNGMTDEQLLDATGSRYVGVQRADIIRAAQNEVDRYNDFVGSVTAAVKSAPKASEVQSDDQHKDNKEK